MLSWKLTAAVPVAMTQSRAVLYNSLLHIGGGFTGSAQADCTVYCYDHSSELWSSLPPAPHKWFTITVFKEQLILVGGKLIKSKGIHATNKIVSWDDSSEQWVYSLPVMQTARLQPCVLSAGRYLAVAGGQRGVLDFSIELLDADTMQWHNGPELPVKAFPGRSFVCGESWYVLSSGVESNIFRFHVPSLVEHVLQSSQDSSSGRGQPWEVLCGPQAHTLSIAAVGGRLLALTKAPSQDRMLRALLYSPERGGGGRWVHVGRVPPQSHTASAAAAASLGGGGALLLVGGTTQEGEYSNKVFTAKLFSAVEAKQRKMHVSFY